VLPLALMLHGVPHPGPLKYTVELVPKFEPLSVIVKAWPCIGGLGLVEIELMLGATGALDTVNDTPPEVRPVVLFFRVTVKEPAARIACPETCVLLPLALTLHGVPHPGPLKYTVEVVPKFDPSSVMVNACPLTGGLGLVEIELMLGATGALDTVNDTPPEVRPVVLFFRVTVKEPAARIACPETCVLLPLALTLHGVPQPGPLK